MKFVNDATAKDTAFIKCFPDDSGVYARVLTETELDTRYIIPHCVHSAIVVTMNARKLYRVFFPLRCCARAQWEIRDLAQAILVLSKKSFQLCLIRLEPVAKSLDTARKDRTKPEEQCHAGSPYTRANTCP